VKVTAPPIKKTAGNNIYMDSDKALCIDDGLSLNNSRFGDFFDCIYPIELEIKDTTDTNWSASYLDLHIEIDIVCHF
jgi:hypothetical protein